MNHLVLSYAKLEWLLADKISEKVDWIEAKPKFFGIKKRK